MKKINNKRLKYSISVLTLLVILTNLNINSAAKITSNIDNNTPENQRNLIESAKTGNLEKVQSLINSGIEVDAIDDKGFTALIWAVNFRHTEMIKFLIKAKANVNAASFLGTTSLILAARYGHKEIVELLLKAGANVNAFDYCKVTPLMGASGGGGNKETVELLLNSEADTEKTDHYGQRAVDYARIAKKQNIVKLLLAEPKRRKLADERYNKIIELLNTTKILPIELKTIIKSYFPSDRISILTDYSESIKSKTECIIC